MSSAPSGLRAGETLALIAIGANLGDRLATMRAAVECLARTDGVRVLAQSGVYDTAPVGPPDQPRYLNAGVAVASTLGPRELLAALLAVEATLGRERGATRWIARTIDLDLVLFGECVLAEGDIQVPHPRYRERAFVLLPLTEIAGQTHDPVTGERLESLLRACPGRSDAVRVGPLDPSAQA